MKSLSLALILIFGLLTQGNTLSAYDNLILSDNPVGYWLLKKGETADASPSGLNGTYGGSCRGQATLPNGDSANVFNGLDNYFEISDHNALEVTTTGVLTIEAWMRIDAYDFPDNENNYVHWMGKGTSGQNLWVARMYNQNDASRPQRISGYCFNLNGGLGAGSYFQDAISLTTWVYYTLVVNTKVTSTKYPTGYTKVYRDGILRDTDGLQEYNIIPGNGTAPTRIGTRDFNSFFKGAIGKVAIFNYELTAAQLLAHKNSMVSSVSPASTADFTAPQCE